jgi:Trypsin-co-occurring domain 1
VTEIKIAVAPANDAEMVGGRKLDDFAARATDIGNALNEVASSLRDNLDQLAQQQAAGWNLDQVTLGFSLEIQGSTAIIIATASAKAGMQATMTWKRST